MARKSNPFLEVEDKYELTAMIDVVFLLLIYFMFLPIQQEADLGITLPSPPPPDAEVSPEIPMEHLIQILPNGQILLNQQPMGGRDSREMPDMVSTLTRLRLAADAGNRKMVVTIDADPDSPHQRAVDAMNALKKAGVKLVSFTMEG